MVLEAHSQLLTNMVLKVDAATLDRGPLPSLNVARSYLAAVKASLISETLTIIKILFIEQEM